MGFWSKTPANQLGGFKNVWDFTGYGISQVMGFHRLWVMTGMGYDRFDCIGGKETLYRKTC